MIYISSSCIQQKNIAEVIQLLAENNIRNIELSGGTDYYDEIENDLKRLKPLYCLNYVCHAYFPPPRNAFVVNLASCDDKIYEQSLEHYISCIDMLKNINCKVLSIHAGFLVEIGTNEIGRKLNNRIVYEEGKAYDRFCSAYEKIAGLCFQNGIELFLENNVLNSENYVEFEYHNYMMMTDYASIMKMKNQLKFNLLLDLGHLHVSAKTLGFSYVEECDKLKEYVRWIHISENDGIFDEHKPLIENSIILNEFNKMYAQRPDMNVTLETVGNIDNIWKSIKLIESSRDMLKEG